MKKIIATIAVATCLAAVSLSAAHAQQAIVTPNGATAPTVGAYLINPSGAAVTSGDSAKTVTLNLGTINNVSAAIPITNGESTLAFSSTGITSSGATVAPQVSADCTTYSSVPYVNAVGASFILAASDVVNARINVSGFACARFIANSAGSATSATIVTNATTGPSTVAISAGTALGGTFNIAGNASAATHVSNTTSATAGVSSTVVAAFGVTKGIVLQNTCGTAEWFSSSVAAGTALTAANSMTLAPGASFVTPDWYPILGAWTIASATAVACTYVADYK